MPSHIANFDFSALDLFWQVVDLLKQGGEPDSALWDKLFACPGYAALTASEFTTEFFQAEWRLAFHPDQDQERMARQEAGKDRFLRHYLRVSELRSELGQYVAELKENNVVAEEARRLAVEWLPAGDYSYYPPVSFVIFDLDGRGYNPVTLDLLATKELAEGMTLFLAHEFHHYYLLPQMKYRACQMPEELQDLWWVISQIHLEGIADTVNRLPLIDAGSPRVRGYLQAVEQVPDYLRQLEQGLQELRRNPERVAEIVRQLRQTLPQAGHPVGFYIARVILRAFGKERLIATTTDPFVFLTTYLEASDQLGSVPELTRPSIQSLAALIDRCI